MAPQPVVGRWTDDEHSTFISLLKHFGRKWLRYRTFLPSRTNEQIRSHAQKYFKRMANNNIEIYVPEFDDSEPPDPTDVAICSAPPIPPLPPPMAFRNSNPNSKQHVNKQPSNHNSNSDVPASFSLDDASDSFTTSHELLDTKPHPPSATSGSNVYEKSYHQGLNYAIVSDPFSSSLSTKKKRRVKKTNTTSGNDYNNIASDDGVPMYREAHKIARVAYKIWKRQENIFTNHKFMEMRIPRALWVLHRLVSGTYVFANMKSADSNHDAEHAIALATRDAIYAELVAVKGLKTGHSMYEIFLPSIFDPSVWRISVGNTNKRSKPVYYYSLRDSMSSSAGEGPDKLKGLRSALDLNCKILDGRIELWEVKTSNKKRKGETSRALAEKKKKASLANKPSAVQEEFQEAYIKQEIAYQNFKKELHLQNGHNELEFEIPEVFDPKVWKATVSHTIIYPTFTYYIRGEGGANPLDLSQALKRRRKIFDFVDVVKPIKVSLFPKNEEPESTKASEPEHNTVSSYNNK